MASVRNAKLIAVTISATQLAINKRDAFIGESEGIGIVGLKGKSRCRRHRRKERENRMAAHRPAASHDLTTARRRERKTASIHAFE
jgi:hypothetical protein